MRSGFGDPIQVIEGLSGLSGPPYAYYGGSAFEPADLPPRGAMWLPGHRLATKVPGDDGTVFHANPPFRWGEQSGRMREYPAWDDPGYPDWIDPVRGGGIEGQYGEDLTARVYAQPIQARIPTGVVPRMRAAGMHYVIRGQIYPGDVGPSVAGLGQAIPIPGYFRPGEYQQARLTQEQKAEAEAAPLPIRKAVSPWVWVAGLAAVGIFAAVAYGPGFRGR